MEEFLDTCFAQEDVGDECAELGIVAETIYRVDVARGEIARLGEVAMLPHGMSRATYRIPSVDLAAGRDGAGDDVGRPLLAAGDGLGEIVIWARPVRLVDDLRVRVGADAVFRLPADDLTRGESALVDEVG